MPAVTFASPVPAQADTPAQPRWRPACCFIVPPDVLQRYSRDPSLSDATRKALQSSYLETKRLRGLREAHRVATLREPDRFASGLLGAAAAPPHTPVQHIFDCQHRKNLPGTPVPRPDGAFKTAFDTTAKLVEFYASVLGRNSIDDQGFDLASSLHYGVDYDNAFWDGRQMVYGDGDGQLFTEMVLSPDVIGHELTHGVTQNESALRYEGESGALNESISDVFGAVFNQWLHQWPTSEAQGWLIGAGILAAPARAKGLSCLRDMVTPSARHCLSPQPERYDQIDPTADVHDNSGVPNKAFARFASGQTGPSWGDPVKVWYDACTDRALRPDATFAEFAALTVAAAGRRGGKPLAAACTRAWAEVGVPKTPAATAAAEVAPAAAAAAKPSAA